MGKWEDAARQAASNGVARGFQAQQARAMQENEHNHAHSLRDKDHKHSHMLQLERLAHESKQSLDNYERQKQLKTHEQQLKEQDEFNKAEVMTKRLPPIENSYASIVGDRKMSAQEKTPFVKDALFQFQKLGIHTNIDASSARVDESDPDFIIVNSIGSEEPRRITAASLIGTEKGKEAYYKSKFSEDGVNPYEKKSADELKRAHAKQELSQGFDAFDKLIAEHGDKTSESLISQKYRSSIGSDSITEEQRALKTVGDTIKGSLFSMSGYQNKDEFYYVPSPDPKYSLGENKEIVKQLRLLKNLSPEELRKTVETQYNPKEQGQREEKTIDNTTQEDGIKIRSHDGRVTIRPRSELHMIEKLVKSGRVEIIK